MSDVVHQYTTRQYGPTKSDTPWIGRADLFRLLCTREWINESEYVAKGPYRVRRPKSVTSVRRHVTCPECLKILLPQILAEVEEMKAAYEKNTGTKFGDHKHDLHVPSVPERSDSSSEEPVGDLVETLPGTL